MGDQTSALALGLDFGTESVRALLVDLKGCERGSAVRRYRHGQILDHLPGSKRPLPALTALQHPIDWIDAGALASRAALRAASAASGHVISVGVAFTSCTMLPVRDDGVPICCLPRFAGRLHAWPKLWKHHAAFTQTERINAVARARRERFLARYGGVVGLEWLLPKILQCVEEDPAVHEATDLWLEGGDWLVGQLTGARPGEPVRSTCQAGYKALWSRESRGNDGFPSRAFLRAVNPELEDLVQTRLRGTFRAPGESAGGVCAAMAKRFGLRAGTPVSAAVIDAHAGVPGAGVSGAGTLVMVLGTSSCHMINDRQERAIPGVAGIVRDGILPGYVGYETGQAAVGDAFAWLARTVGRSLDDLNVEAATIEPGAGGVRCLDWMNGCRTPYMDGTLTGRFEGLRIEHGAAHLYRSLLEATACGVRMIVDLLESGGVAVRRLVATGGLPHHHDELVRIYADVVGRPITVHPSRHGPALGAAILGVTAAGRGESGFSSPATTIRAMASPGRHARTVRPRAAARRAYEGIYADYRAAAEAEVRAGGDR